MTQLSSRRLAFSVYLAGVAGFVDSVGFLNERGFFLSFMSGNTTRMGVRAATQEPETASLIAGVIILFVLGVMAGTWVNRKVSRSPREWVLVLVTTFLTFAAGMVSQFHPLYGLGPAVMAMGAMNTVFDGELDGEFSFTFVTGALVRGGKRLTDFLLGDRTANPLPYLGLWGGLASGAAFGAGIAFLPAAARLLIAAALTLLGVLVPRQLRA